MAPRTSLACILTGPSRSAPDSDFIFLDGTLNQVLPGRPTASRNRVARGGTQGGPNCLTHALPRCLPTPTEEADGNGYGVITGRSDPPWAAV